MFREDDQALIEYDNMINEIENIRTEFYKKLHQTYTESQLKQIEIDFLNVNGKFHQCFQQIKTLPIAIRQPLAEQLLQIKRKAILDTDKYWMNEIQPYLYGF